MESVLTVAIRGIGIGAVFAILAVCINVTYQTTRIVNLAIGHMLVLGGVLSVVLTDGSWSSWLIGLPVAGLVMAVALAVQGFLTLLPLRGASNSLSWLVTTLSAAIVITAVIQILRGTGVMVASHPFPTVQFLGTELPVIYIVVVAFAILAYLGVSAFYGHTRTGLAMSAVAQDTEAAQATGIAVRRTQLLAFALTGLLLGMGGYLAAPILTLSADSGLHYVMLGFVAAVLGGIGNQRGAAVGGLALGAISMVLAYQVGGMYQDAGALAILVAVLLLRPRGLFGAAARREV
jgi:branched-chain amino acid transport system permease protein